MEILAVYDICDPKRLRKIAKMMEGYGLRVQYSVFECQLTNTKIEEMKKNVSKTMNLLEDGFRIYPLMGKSRQKQTIIGKGNMNEFAEAYAI